MDDCMVEEEEEYNDKVKGFSKKRLRKPKTLEFVGWGSRNLIEFLESLGKDTTNKISEYDVTEIVKKYIREKNLTNPSRKNKKTKSKIVACDKRLSLLFESKKINIIRLPDLVSKHYVENQEDSYNDYICSLDDDKQQRLFRLDKIAKETKQVVEKPKGTFAAIVRDNIKLLYLRKSLVEELAKTPETFECKVIGTFVRIKKPFQLVQVTGVKEGNPIDGYFLQVTNYSYYLTDVPSSVLSDDDFSQEECEELHQRMKTGCAKRLTVVDMEEKVRSLHEDVTRHWLERELVLLQRRINQANEKGWRRELSEYLEKRELLKNPEEQSRLLREVPEVVAEEPEPECVHKDGKMEDDFMVQPNLEVSIDTRQRHEEQQLCVDNDGKIEDDLVEPNLEVSIDTHQSDEEHQLSDSPISSLRKTEEIFNLDDEEDQPTQATSAAVEKDLNEDVEEHLGNGITQNKDPITTEREMKAEVTQDQLSSPVTHLYNEPQAQSSSPEIIVLSDDDEEEEEDKEENEAYQDYDPKKVMWFYEFPKGKVNGPFSLTDLKNWSDEGYFDEVADFKVWMIGKSIKSGVLLAKLLPHI